jgi:hypothetical protein
MIGTLGFDSVRNRVSATVEVTEHLGAVVDVVFNAGDMTPPRNR